MIDFGRRLRPSLWLLMALMATAAACSTRSEASIVVPEPLVRQAATPTAQASAAPTLPPATPDASQATAGATPSPDAAMATAATEAALEIMLPDGGEIAEADPPRLVVPALELDQTIVSVPIVDGAWDLTQLGHDIGWLTTTGERPGDDLAMTLVGHVTISLGNEGPFSDLRDLEVGDQVIYRAKGLDYVYSVRDIAKVKPEEIERLYVEDGQRLLLVTCSDWSYWWRQYALRLIVEAELVQTLPSP